MINLPIAELNINDPSLESEAIVLENSLELIATFAEEHKLLISISTQDYANLPLTQGTTLTFTQIK